MSAICWRSECRNGCYYPDVCSVSKKPAQAEPADAARDKGEAS